ncbi:MAG: HupE/UreJ family protein [Akkermansiaceae bacterium]|nr:HupE/UreJ family protein [Verrucomicrobiales bacterium]
MAWLLILFPPTVRAHKLSDSYLTLTSGPSEIHGRWDIALRDLEYAIGLDADDDGKITWGELRSRSAEVSGYALARLTLEADGQVCLPTLKDFLVEQHSDGAYVQLRFVAVYPEAPKVLQVGYRLLSEFDPQHRGILNLEHQAQTRLAVFSPEHPVERFELAAPVRSARQFVKFFREGVWHIWIGFDHILFLLALLLPSVLKREDRQWVVVREFRPAALNVLKVVTAFTIAHSITLTLATLQLVQLPARLVESAIAISVVLAAFNNIVPFFHGRGWWVAFAFGLIHGFGFANVLADLELPRQALATALLAFNLGVEAGQLTIVAGFLPIAFALRQSWFYRTFTLRAGSACVALIAGTWAVERWFDFKILPF